MIKSFSRKIKSPLAVLLCTAPLIFSGCSNSAIEVRDRAFVQAIGIDGFQKPVVAVSIFGDEENSTFEGSGATVFEAISNAEANQSRNLFIGHIELIAIGKSSTKETLEALMTNNRITPSCSIVYCDDSAADLIADKSSLDLLETVKIKSKSGIISKRSISAVLDDMLGSDNAAAIPIVSGNEISMAVIDENGLIDTLSKDEALGLSWLCSSIKTLTMPVETGEKPVNLRIENVKTKVSSSIDGKKIKVNFSISFNGTVLEKNVNIDSIKNIAKEKIRTLCQSAVSKTVNELSVDVLSIEKSVKAADFNFYLDNKDNFNQLLSNAEFEYDIKLIK